MNTIKLNKYQAVVHLLTEKPEPSKIVGHYLTAKYTADDLADICACSKNSIGTYIGRMRKEGYDVRINKEGEYWVKPDENYCPKFQLSIGKELVTKKKHMISVTHSGNSWTSITLGNLSELRQLHAALGEYIEAISEDYTK